MDLKALIAAVKDWLGDVLDDTTMKPIEVSHSSTFSPESRLTSSAFTVVSPRTSPRASFMAAMRVF